MWRKILWSPTGARIAGSDAWRNILHSLVAGVIILLAKKVFAWSPRITLTALTVSILTIALQRIMSFILGNRQFVALGMTGIWQGSEQFRKQLGQTFSDYCEAFVRQTPPGEKIRVVAYDATELLGETPILGRHLGDREGRGSIEITLLDPNSPVAIAKRAAEMDWRDSSGNTIYPEGLESESLLRLKKKIETSLNVARIHEQTHPDVFELHQTQGPLMISVLINEQRALALFHTPYHKGKDSLIVEARKLPAIKSGGRLEAAFGGGLYGWLNGYVCGIFTNSEWLQQGLEANTKVAASS